MADAGASTKDGKLFVYECPECNYILPPGYGSGLICTNCYEADCVPVWVVKAVIDHLGGHSMEEMGT